ncbi:unnamed protein product [Soboliphyme baturini]|uniref:Ty3-gypsy retrotransposon protein n=1 Tax=Soboliphyme baturini TaxID=241478 RepID=A0A183J9P6_9BILA|nr:unnamed protein product [Soboliphyme baturini]
MEMLDEHEKLATLLQHETPPMSFRSSYYAKVGFEAINVEKKLDSIFASPVIDNDMLGEVSLNVDSSEPAQAAVCILMELNLADMIIGMESCQTKNTSPTTEAITG